MTKTPGCDGCQSNAFFHDDDCPERWTNTSFADAIECAIHYAMIEFVLATQLRGFGSDLSDIYIEHRRLIRDLATGKKDALEYLRERP